MTAPERSQRLRDTIRLIKRDLLSGQENRQRYDLGLAAAELVSLSNGEVKSLRKLAELAVGQVPGCAAAHASIWSHGELKIGRAHV